MRKLLLLLVIAHVIAAEDTVVASPLGLYCRLFTGTSKIRCTLPTNFRTIPYPYSYSADTVTIPPADLYGHDDGGISVGVLFDIYHTITLGTGIYISLYSSGSYAETAYQHGMQSSTTGWAFAFCEFGSDCMLVPELTAELAVCKIHDHQIKLSAIVSYEHFSATNGWDRYDSSIAKDDKALAHIFPIDVSLKFGVVSNSLFLELGSRLYPTKLVYTTPFGRESNFKPVDGVYIACSGESFFTTRDK